MSQRTETREVFHHFAGHPIPCVTDFSDTVKAVLDPRATEIDGRFLHLAQPPGPMASSSAPEGRTPGTA